MYFENKTKSSIFLVIGPSYDFIVVPPENFP